MKLLHIGDKIYIIEKKLDTKNNKITMIDDDGNTWHRYINPPVTHYIGEYYIVGMQQVVKTGNVPDELAANNMAFLSNCVSKEISDFFLEDIQEESENYFLDIEEAKKALEKRRKTEHIQTFHMNSN